VPAATTASPATIAPTTASTTEGTAASTVPCPTVGDLFALDAAAVSVRRGDCGQGVSQLQEQLNYKLGISLAVDGIFGPGTETAVRDFQSSVGLTADGIVGPMTWVALNDDGT
jgi:peptidoglycan hydrolase-like protein with peptidoglycan-binding domain